MGVERIQHTLSHSVRHVVNGNAVTAVLGWGSRVTIPRDLVMDYPPRALDTAVTSAGSHPASSDFRLDLNDEIFGGNF